MAKHTPAPWRIQFMKGEENPDFWVKSDHNDVVHYGTDIMCEDYGEHNGYPREQRLADAALISSAPELLKTLQELYHDLRQGAMPNFKELNQIEELIKKATGDGN